MRIVRWLRHLFATPLAARRAYPEASLARIQQAIARTEAHHTGEIRFAVEAALPWSYLRRDAPVRERALMVFSKLRVWDTEQNNGVLIYVELADHGIEIVADRGIARHVSRDEWQAICDAMRERFRAGDYEGGALTGIERVGKKLAQFFPVAPGQTNPNELSNRPAIL
ncbi:MAG: TPM domain-containing protein [Burkholderiaceae bacterium]